MSDFRETPVGQSIDLAQLQIDLQLVIGELKMSVTDLGNMQPGTVLPFNLAEERAAVQVYAGDQKVALGAFVRVGERIGVRITKNLVAPKT